MQKKHRIAFIPGQMIELYEKKGYTNNALIFPDSKGACTMPENRHLRFLLILFYNLYINYQQYELEKQKRSDLAPFRQQIYASILNTIAAVIILYVVYETLNTNDDIAPIDNTI